MITEKQVKFRKMKEIIIWKEDILHLEIWFPEMLPAVLQKKDAMQVMVLVHRNRQYIWIMQKPLCVMEKWNAIKMDIDNPSSEIIRQHGREVVKEKYGNLFDMYEKITGENPYEVPMRIYPAVHYTMGGLWVDYELMTTIPDCIVWEKQIFLIMVLTVLVLLL